MRARLIFALAAGLALAAFARDRMDMWIDATVLPPLAVETSTEVRARDGTLLRAFTVADGRWRLATDAGAVDPAYVAMLVDYEDGRFYSHPGVDVLSLARAAVQAASPTTPPAS